MLSSPRPTQRARRPRTAAQAFFLGCLLSSSRSATAHDDPDAFHYESAGRCEICEGAPSFHYDIRNDGTYRFGTITSGTDSNVGGCPYLLVSGTYYDSPTAYVQRSDDRGVTGGELEMGGLTVSREIYVPDDSLDFARFVDSFRNDGASDVTVTARYACAYPTLSAGAETPIARLTRDGDDELELTDPWYALQVEDTGKAAFGLLVFSGPDVPEIPTEGTDYPAIAWAYSLTVAPGETQQILTFFLQGDDVADVGATADYLLVGPDEMMTDWATIPSFMNFVPEELVVSAGGPYEVPEGGEIVLEPRAYGPAASVEFAWDFAGGSDFLDSSEESPLLTMEMIAALADGPDRFEVAVQVTAGSAVEEARTDVDVVNVAPIVLSEPPLRARVGGEYTYRPVLVDPAGDADAPYAISLAEAESPAGMRLDDSGLTPAILWTPAKGDIATSPHSVRLIAEDADESSSEQAWEIVVHENDAPGSPTARYPTDDACVATLEPTLMLANAADPDDDPLTYVFDLDTTPSFTSPALVTSGPVPAGGEGHTEWRVPTPLQPQTEYYWRARASDGLLESEPVVELFGTCAAHTTTGKRSGGCGCAASGNPLGASLAFGTGAWLLRRKTRRQTR